MSRAGRTPTERPPSRVRAPWGRDLVHPLPLAAAVVLSVNDHVLKRVAPSALTGKLSDFAGLFFFPILLATLARGACVLARRAEPGTRALAVAAGAATAVMFSAVKLLPAVNGIVVRTWGVMVMDRSDLIALPMTLLAALFLTRAHRASSEDTEPLPTSPNVRSRAARDVRQVAATLFCAAASLATSAPRVPHCQTRMSPAIYRLWSDVCVQTEGVNIVIRGARAELELVVTPKVNACQMPIQEIVIEYEVESAAARASTDVPELRVEGPTPLHVAIDLPWKGSCDLSFEVAAAARHAPSDATARPLLPLRRLSCKEEPQ